MFQSAKIGARALIPNPALMPFEFLIGEWRTRGTHPQLPGKSLIGRTSFGWHESGAFVIMRTEVDEPQFPNGLAIIGSDDVAEKFVMTYFDEREVSRIYGVIVGDRTVTWRRDNPLLSQTMTITSVDGGDTMIGTGQMSVEGGEWGSDLSQIYERERDPGRD